MLPVTNLLPSARSQHGNTLQGFIYQSNIYIFTIIVSTARNISELIVFSELLTVDGEEDTSTPNRSVDV